MHMANRDTEVIQRIIFVFLVIVNVLFQLLIPKHFINHLVFDKYFGLRKTKL
jgi:hypothetical protein